MQGLNVTKTCTTLFIDFILISVNVSKWRIIVDKLYKLLKDHVDDNLEDYDMAMSSDSTMILLMKMKKLSLLMMW
jgi:hypothetical protein